MNLSESNELINTLNNTVIYLHKYILPFFYIVSNIGNLISVLIFSKKSWRKNVCVFYFQIYILYSSIYINTTVVASILNVGYNINAQNLNIFLCKIYFYISFLFATLSPSVLVLASIDRLLISSQNVNTRLYSSKRLAYLSISLSTFFWIIFNCHTLIKVNIIEYFPSVWICFYEPSKMYRDFVFYFLSTINIVYGFLLIILSIFAFKNIRYLRFIPSQQRNQIRTMKKKDFQLLRCLFAEDIVFITFKFWIYVYYVYLAITKEQIRTPLQETINSSIDRFGSFLYNISYGANFFIFISISKAFRQEFKRMFYLTISREEDNRQENIEMNVVTVSTFCM